MPPASAHLFFIAIAAGALSIATAAGCGSPDEDAAALADSRAVWNRLKRARGPDYAYTARDASSTGLRSETTIEVRDGRVFSRAFVSHDEDGTPRTAWRELDAQLGSHPEGAPPLTIDQIYDRCGSEVLTKDRGANDVVLTFHADGVLHTCVFVSKGCADDCDQGYRISLLSLAR